DTHVDFPQWRDSKGVLSKFSVRGAWEALRLRGTEVAWYHIVWFSNNIPRHAFNLWLVMRRNLKTQDRVRQWDVDLNVDLSTLRYIDSLLSRRSPEELRDAIIVTVRLKLLTFRFKNTTAVQDILARWKMPSSFRLYS
ncbi:zinc finger, CCHC-type containing protein, partial [Tanacetum coccineum]